MDTIGLDLHKRESQLCILADDGEIHERRIVTSRERFTAVLGNRLRARIILEASTESEWVAQHLESLGYEVVVADPNYAPMYATRRRRVKEGARIRVVPVAPAKPLLVERARRPLGQRRDHRLRTAAHGLVEVREVAEVAVALLPERARAERERQHRRRPEQWIVDRCPHRAATAGVRNATL